jgi:hypothetical protein
MWEGIQCSTIHFWVLAVFSDFNNPRKKKSQSLDFSFWKHIVVVGDTIMTLQVERLFMSAYTTVTWVFILDR